MEKYSNRHDSVIKEFIRKTEPGEDLTDKIKVVKITRESVKFLGFLAGNSIIIPLSSGNFDEDAISQVVARNIHTVDVNSDEVPEVAVCHLLGLCYNSRNNGLYSDGTVISDINAVHLYPGGYIEDQKDFIKFASEQLKLAGTKLTVFEK